MTEGNGHVCGFVFELITCTCVCERVKVKGTKERGSDRGNSLEALRANEERHLPEKEYFHLMFRADGAQLSVRLDYLSYTLLDSTIPDC